MAYDQGDTARMRFEVRDGSGALVMPGGAVTLTITLPDGTSTSPANTSPATGVYVATYLTEQVGRHIVRWVATGSNAETDTDILDVRPPDRGWLISKADARNTLNLRSTADDAELRDWLGVTTRVIERRTGRAWIQRTRTETARGGRMAIPVIWEPIKRVISMVPLLTAGHTYDPAGLVWTSTGLLKLANGTSFEPGEYTLTYVAGDDQALPEEITAASRIILKHLWETQRGGGGLPSRNEDDEFYDPRLGYAIPNRAAELLGDPVGGLG